VDRQLRFAFGDLVAAQDAGVLPRGLLVRNGLWLNVQSELAVAIFCIFLCTAHLLPRYFIALALALHKWL
jgi:hypothetical protein